MIVETVKLAPSSSTSTIWRELSPDIRAKTAISRGSVPGKSIDIYNYIYIYIYAHLADAQTSLSEHQQSGNGLGTSLYYTSQV